MYRVLIPVDENESRARAQASAVIDLPAADQRVEARLLYVFGDDSPDLPGEVQGFKSATRVGSVRRATELLEEAGVAVSVLEDSGDAADDIVAAAEREEVDAIVMGGRKRSPTGKAVFGSTTLEVIRRTDLPVTVTGAGGEER